MGNLGTNYVLLGIAMATILGVYAITTSAPTTFSTLTTYESMPYLLGHVTIQVADSDGNIKSYQQTDNLVTNQGLVCALDVLFAIPGECASGGDFNHIVLANNGTGNPDVSATDFATAVTDNEIARSVAGATVSISGFDVTISHVFTVGNDDLANLETVDRTGLFDIGTSGGNMLAQADLSETTVLTGDSITVTWTITGDNTP